MNYKRIYLLVNLLVINYISLMNIEYILFVYYFNNNFNYLMILLSIVFTRIY